MAKTSTSALALAAALEVSRQSVSAWRQGRAEPDAGRLADVRRYFRGKGFRDEVPSPVAEAVAPRADYSPGWPDGWRARTYRLVLEATEKGATEEELTVVRSWMLNPQLQALWAGGAPSDDRLGELDGIEVGTRAWLIKRGRKVKPR